MVLRGDPPSILSPNHGQPPLVSNDAAPYHYHVNLPKLRLDARPIVGSSSTSRNVCLSIMAANIKGAFAWEYSGVELSAVTHDCVLVLLLSSSLARENSAHRSDLKPKCSRIPVAGVGGGEGWGIECGVGKSR